MKEQIEESDSEQDASDDYATGEHDAQYVGKSCRIWKASPPRAARTPPCNIVTESPGLRNEVTLHVQ